MPARKRTAAQRALDLDTLADLFAQGKSQREMAQALGVTQPQIVFDLRKLDARWQKERGTWESDKERELARIHYIERQAHAGWERSREDKEVASSEKITGGKDGADRTKAAKRTEGQAGDPAFLNTLLKCSAQRVDLLRPAKRNLPLDTLGELLDALPYDIAFELRAVLGGHAGIAGPPQGADAAASAPPVA
jgi:hypothetical protein